MQPSGDVADAWRRFCRGVSNGLVDEFDDIVSLEAHLVTGTAPEEQITDRSGMRFGFEAEGVRLEARSPRGFEEGTLGWVVDQPRFTFPDGSGMDCRSTVVMRLEDGVWRVVHAHFSVGVPDDEVVALQRRWAAAG